MEERIRFNWQSVMIVARNLLILSLLPIGAMGIMKVNNLLVAYPYQSLAPLEVGVYVGGFHFLSGKRNLSGLIDSCSLGLIITYLIGLFFLAFYPQWLISLVTFTFAAVLLLLWVVKAELAE